MSLIRLREFSGMRPHKAADLLAPGEAQLAENTKLLGGDLEPFKGVASVTTLSGSTQVKSIYRYGQGSSSETNFWFQFTVDADVVKGPVDNDTEERTYFTQSGDYPRKTKADIATSGTPYPSTSLRMGVPAPASGPNVSVTGSATNPDDPAETVSYVVTYVSSWGEEGAPSLASANVSWRPGQSISLTSIAGAPSGNYIINNKRIYRAAVGSTNAAFQFLVELPVGTTSYTDTVPTANLAEVLQTEGWNEPPVDMIGLTEMANGIMAGFTGNTLCFSEPYVPYAWPIRYQQSVDAPIVAIKGFDQSLFVGTTRGIYVVTGTDPANMTMEKLAVSQSCVSKRSVVAMAGQVIFASPDGLFSISSSGLRALTDGVLTREQWQAYKPESMLGCESESAYIAFYDTGVVQGGLVFTLSPEPSLSKTTVFASAAYREKARDALYVVTANTALGKWDAGSPLTFTWTSGVFRLPTECNMAAARISAVTYPVTFQLYADDVLKSTHTVNNGFAFRLPGGYRSTRYHFTLSSSYCVRTTEVATSMAELAS